MILELTIKDENNKLLGKISAHNLESLEEQLHKIEHIIKKHKLSWEIDNKISLGREDNTKIIDKQS